MRSNRCKKLMSIRWSCGDRWGNFFLWFNIFSTALKMLSLPGPPKPTFCSRVAKPAVKIGYEPIVKWLCTAEPGNENGKWFLYLCSPTFESLSCGLHSTWAHIAVTQSWSISGSPSMKMMFPLLNFSHRGQNWWWKWLWVILLV